MDFSSSFCLFEDYLASLNSPLSAHSVTALNCEWRFFAGDTNAPSPGFDDSQWRVLDVPHDWSIEGEFSNKHPATGSGGWLQTGVAWYRTRFPTPDCRKDGKHFLLFDGVSMNCGVWLNGHFLGNHPYGFTPFWFDVAPWMKPAGEENVLAVRVDTSLQPFSRFYHGTGIYRPVWLISTDALHVAQWGVKAETTAATADWAEISVITKVQAGALPDTQWHGFGAEPQRDAARECALITTILDSQEQSVATATSLISVENYTDSTITQCLRVPQPKLWSGEQPYLYRIHTKIVAKDTIIDDAVTPLGIRRITWGAGFGFALNGRPVKLKGVCLHQDSAPWGAAVPAKAWMHKLLTLKEMGCNAVRTAHHPFSSVFYDCCDFLGMMVMDEAFDEWRKGWERDFAEQPWGKNEYGYSLWFDQWHDADMRAMLWRDRNHPSVVMWSVGNEIPDLYYAEGVETIKDLVRICREEDASRPVTAGAEGQYRLPIHDGILEQLDIAGLNYVNIRHPVKYYDGLHAEHPDWVMLGTETFYDPGHIPALKDRPYAVGQFLWVGYDYLGEAFDSTESFDAATGAKRLQHGWAGMVDILDTPRAEYWYRQSLWADWPVAHMAVKTGEWVREWWNQIKAESHWNWAEGETKTIYCFTNCEETELILCGVSLGRRKKDANDPLPFAWEVEYKPGEIELVGYNGGKRACSHRMETAGPAKTLALACDSAFLHAGCTDAAHIGISIVDTMGRVAPGARDRVTTEAFGAGAILAMANGDMNDAEGYRTNSCLAVDGRCMAVIRAGSRPGTIKLKATASGLEPAELILEVK